MDASQWNENQGFVESIQVYVNMLQTNFLQATFHAYSWVTILLIKMSLRRVFPNHSLHSFAPSYACVLIPCLACGGVGNSTESPPNSYPIIIGM
ncbi:hypothetical protein SADUNF_Sadunf16G0172800 [Salix dunnii]|uniref:Uncharacterized protein n=1 Tax=Salix dunnii TaxID=1413687 RepID=A0A835MJB3_9ROSI|nr:hypothetical protein SADUNF_Sadunf16G0172800 [Salix dunnii]